MLGVACKETSQHSVILPAKIVWTSKDFAKSNSAPDGVVVSLMLVPFGLTYNIAAIHAAHEIETSVPPAALSGACYIKGGGGRNLVPADCDPDLRLASEQAQNVPHPQLHANGPLGAGVSASSSREDLIEERLHHELHQTQA